MPNTLDSACCIFRKYIQLNYQTLEATWEEAVDVVKESDIKAWINGVAAKMKEFDFFFFLCCLLLAEKIFKHTDNLNKQFKQHQCLQLRVSVVHQSA